MAVGSLEGVALLVVRFQPEFRQSAGCVPNVDCLYAIRDSGFSRYSLNLLFRYHPRAWVVYRAIERKLDNALVVFDESPAAQALMNVAGEVARHVSVLAYQARGNFVPLQGLTIRKT